ncbi:unnamed protein product [Lampetra fluviatilis]
MTEAAGALDLSAILEAAAVLHKSAISCHRTAPQQQPPVSKMEVVPKSRRLPPLRLAREVARSNSARRQAGNEQLREQGGPGMPWK